MRFDRGSHGSIFFLHKEIHKDKRIGMRRGLRLTRSNRTVQSRFQNHARQ